MKKLIWMGVLLLCLSSCRTNTISDAKIEVLDLTCEMNVNPQGVDEPSPRLAWRIASDRKNVKQKAYRILVASKEAFLEENKGDVWDSGIVKSDESRMIDYQGEKMRCSRYYYWKVLVLTNQSEEWMESPVAHWLTGLYSEYDWKGSQWIGLERAMPWEDEGVHARLSARYLRKEFNCRKPILRAVVHISGLGLYELWLNGQKVGDQVMAPAPTDYRKSIMYNTYDVTDYLAEGQNAVGVILGNGRYYPMRHNYKPYKWADFGYPKMRMVLSITYQDGRREVVGSNTSWQLNANGPIVSNNEFDGEEYDARKEFGAWSEPGFYAAGWRPAERVSIPQAVLRAQPCAMMKVMDTFTPKSITRLNDKTYIMDMGQNMTGWIRMKVKGKEGQTVQLRFAETLLADGSLSMANLRDAYVTDKYTLKGDPEGEEWAPRFVTHGFRYVELTNYPGEPKLENFVGEFVCDEMADQGYLETSSEVLNGIIRNAYWGIRGNYKGMPVDCPQRNERMPWLGDRVIGAYGESFLFDNGNLYAKWMDDIREAQRWDGAIPDVAPAYWNYYSDDVTWPAAFFMGTDMLYRQFGDKRPIEKNYASMKKWMEYMHEHYARENGVLSADKYGDWCMPPENTAIIHSNDPSRMTEGALISTAYFCALYRIMAGFATVLDYPEDAEYYAQAAEKMKEVFHTQFFNEDAKCYGNNTVTANLLPLAFGIVPEKDIAGVCENIRQTIMDVYGGTMTTGVIGTQWIMRQLTANGMEDIAYLLATTQKYPSWGYMLSKGATTIWELWNGDKAAPSMNSGNHVMLLGDLLIWAYEDLAGIKSAAPGFKEIQMMPAFSISDLRYVKSSYRTPYGKVESSWEKNGNALCWQVTIPANTSAKIYIPQTDKKAIFENDLPIWKAEGLNYIGQEKGCSVWKAVSGSYAFRVNL